MKMSCATAIVIAAAVCTAFLWTPLTAHAQSLQMTWVDRSGKTIGTVGPGGPYRGPDLAPDGKRFLVHRHDETDPSRNGGGDVWLFESGSGPGTRLAGDGSGKVENVMPIWSPDGARVVFGSFRNGKGGLYMKRADGTGAEELLIESETSKIPMSWSPDGQYIVYWVSGNIQWILPLTGDRKPFQFSEGSTSHAQISPDGKWVAYQTFEGRGEIYVKPFPTGSGRVQVSKDGGFFARWRGDGKELFFLSLPSNGQMMAADITVNGSTLQAGAPHALFDSGYVNLNHPSNYHVFGASRDGQRFLIPRLDASPGPDDPNARTLTLFDRQGKAVGTVGERGFYQNLAVSPDQTRVTLLRTDPVKGTVDVWVFDLATGKGIPITSNKREDATRTPVWSPDGKHIAYVTSRSGAEAIYRKLSNGEGSEELVYKFNGAGITLQEWTLNYLTYYSQQLGGNIEFALPLTGDQKPIEIARSQFVMLAAHLSPDNRFLAFRSNESGKDQIWVRRFDPSGPSSDKWQVSTDGGTGPVFWRADGRELYYVSLDRGLMVVNVRTDSGFEFGAPRLLFKVPEAFPAGQGIGPFLTMSQNAERFLFAVPRTPPPPPPLPQITILDRQGKSVQMVGEPGRYSDATFSPDGSHVLVRKSPETVGDTELWSFDVATGKGTLVASGQITFSNMLWTPDGKQVFYGVNRPGGFQVIMRKAADGSGSEEMIYQYTPGAPVNINDITPDGKFLTFDSGGVILIVPLTGGDTATRKAIEIAREEYFTFGGRFSPDGRSIAYLSTETDRAELYVRPFDPGSGKLVGETKVQLTKDGVSSIVSWRADGRELYYRKGDMNDALTMAVDVSTAPSLQAGTPQFLFRAANARGAKNISRDGQRFVVVMPKN